MAVTAELAADLAVVRKARVAFYHHSVGADVLAGVARLDAAAGGGRLRLASWEEAVAVDGPVLANGEGGRNGDPRGKVDAFAAIVRGQSRLRPDLAFMKFCYVDFDPGTDVDALLSHYRETLQALKAEHPGIRFAHVTAPLFRRPADLKSSARRLLGLQVWEDAANAKRAEYNRRLVEAFPGDPVFDLAGVEAGGPGAPGAAPSLLPEFTEDGGHLNAAGQATAGAAAIRFLAGALPARMAGR